MEVSVELLKKSFEETCGASVVGSEWTVHQLAPYIGKIKSSIAKFLIQNFTAPGDIIYDPFCGAGTIPYEAWTLGRNVIANDLNKYAFVLTSAKLSSQPILKDLLSEIDNLHEIVSKNILSKELHNVPNWVMDFFHPQTLKEILVWVDLLTESKSWFLLSCLLGILHHQRPGFLSYPSSHTVPYLRLKKFPKEIYPELYEYRDVRTRLKKKVERALKRQPSLDDDLNRIITNENAVDATKIEKVNAIITSPPYMRKLDYARDNRLRLWFLGISSYNILDEIISPTETDFVSMIKMCLKQWEKILVPGGKCILFLGDNFSKKLNATLPHIVQHFATQEIGSYKLIFKHESLIPNNRRVRRNLVGNKSETVLTFEKINLK